MEAENGRNIDSGVPGVIDGKFTLGFLSPQDNVKRQGVEIPSQAMLTADDAMRYRSY